MGWEGEGGRTLVVAVAVGGIVVRMGCIVGLGRRMVAAGVVGFVVAAGRRRDRSPLMWAWLLRCVGRVVVMTWRLSALVMQTVDR